MKSHQQLLSILYLSAEVVPFAKTGGLADVAGALPKAIRALGHDIRVAMPRYGRIDIERFRLRPVIDSLDVPMDGAVEPARILQGALSDALSDAVDDVISETVDDAANDGFGEPDHDDARNLAEAAQIPVYFVDSKRYFDRQGIYMYPDDAERFIFFSRAALEMCRALGWRPDVIHCNEWHTALIPNWLKTIYQEDPFFARTTTLYTAHNLEYQGIFGQRVLEIAGLADMGFIAHPDMAPDLNYVVDMMARGLLFADIINTVSETHAREILTPEYGHRLDPILRDRRDRLFGILNGIDIELYNPATDPHIASRFDIKNVATRATNKSALQAEAGLPLRTDVPLVSMVGRLIDQKGFDLISAIVDPMLQQLGCQFVVMGTGESRYHDMLNALAARCPDQAAVFLTFNRPLEQRIYAGSDIFMMPSRSEPCGLNQMVAMRYGSVPVVHAVGGLADSVANYVPETGQGNGFSFDDYDPMAFYTALVRAVETYRHGEIWRQLMHRCMAADFSWKRSAQRYVDLYRRGLAIRRQRPRSLSDYALLQKD